MRIIQIVLILLLPMFVFAQDEESNIKTTVLNYLDGGTNGDIEQFKSAFVSSAIQRSIGKNGDIIGMTVEKLSSKIKPGSKMNRETRIVSISYAGIAATAITETIYPKSKIVDMLNLLKTDGEWKIVSRVYSRIGADEEIQGSQNSSPMSTPQVEAYNKPVQKTPKPAPKKKKETVTWDDEW